MDLETSKDKYIPAFGLSWLSPLYDLFMKLVMRETAFKTELIRRANIQPGQRVLDLGCGTATLTLLIKHMHPQAEVVGLDGDPQILKIARRKLAAAGLGIPLDQGMAHDLPYADSSFDRVVSSLVLHHLTHDNKVSAMREVLRVLRPAGRFHVVDFGPPHGHLAGLFVPLLRHHEAAGDNFQGLIPPMMQEAGFARAGETATFRTLVGSLSFFQAEK
jgi:ubiquinone/menaquinone biosynthesis C-methylase UbiE